MFTHIRGAQPASVADRIAQLFRQVNSIIKVLLKLLVIS